MKTKRNLREAAAPHPPRENALSIPFLQSDASDMFADGWVHRKTVPFTIVVQPLSGAYRVTTAGKTVTAKPGETVIVPANQEVTFEHRAAPAPSMSAHWVHVSWKLYNAIDLTILVDIPLLVKGSRSRRFGEIIRELRRSGTDTSAEMSRLARRNRLGFVLLELLLSCSHQREGIEDYTSRTRRLQGVFDYINDHLDNPMTIKELAAVANLSASRFFATFQELTGLSPMSFIRQQRLGEASKLLRTTDFSVGRIAEATGFPNQFHFSRVFKEYQGASPREYRESRF